MKNYSILAIILIVVSIIPVFAQQTETDRARQERARADQQRRIEEEQARINRASGEQQRRFADWIKESRARERARKTHEYRPLSVSELKAIRNALAPNSEDAERYKTFLNQPDTGLFRLMPNFGCSEKYTVSADERCAKSAYLGEYFSFRREDYSGKEWSDLTFKDGNLISRGFFSQGILTSLGNLPLEEISINNNEIKFLTDFQPDGTLEKVKEQSRQLNAGINFNNYQYAKSLKAIPKTSYVLRVIAYRPEIKKLGRDESLTQAGFRILSVNADKRADLIVAFRIVRADDDGSLIILWKKLKEVKSPKILIEKKAETAEIDD